MASEAPNCVACECHHLSSYWLVANAESPIGRIRLQKDGGGLGFSSPHWPISAKAEHENRFWCIAVTAYYFIWYLPVLGLVSLLKYCGVVPQLYLEAGVHIKAEQSRVMVLVGMPNITCIGLQQMQSATNRSSNIGSESRDLGPVGFPMAMLFFFQLYSKCVTPSIQLCAVRKLDLVLYPEAGQHQCSLF